MICWAMTLSPEHLPSKDEVRKAGVLHLTMQYERIKYWLAINDAETIASSWQSYLEPQIYKRKFEDDEAEWDNHRNGFVFINPSLDDWCSTNHNRPLLGFVSSDCHYGLVCFVFDAKRNTFDMSFHDLCSHLFANTDPHHLGNHINCIPQQEGDNEK